MAAAANTGVESRVAEPGSRDDVSRISPSPCGVFGIGLDGQLLSYHHQPEKDLQPLLHAPRRKEEQPVTIDL